MYPSFVIIRWMGEDNQTRGSWAVRGVGERVLILGSTRKCGREIRMVEEDGVAVDIAGRKVTLIVGAMIEVRKIGVDVERGVIRGRTVGEVLSTSRNFGDDYRCG